VAAKIGHNGDTTLAGAVAAVVKREVGDGFVWQRRDPTGTSRPSLVTAATMAYWGALTGGEVPKVAAASSTGRVAKRRR
jgi:hypothetical protein